MSDATLPPPPEPGERIAEDVADAVLAEAATAVDGLAQPEAFTPLDVPRRMLLVHAHPDDETIGTGATMAKYAASGALVTLVTCTLGEEGEILEPGLEHLAADKDDKLGQHRIGELAAAMEALAVRDRHCRFPGCRRSADSAGTDLDHTIPWPQGPTTAANLAVKLGLARQMKEELQDCPPTLVLIARHENAFTRYEAHNGTRTAATSGRATSPVSPRTRRSTARRWTGRRRS